MSALAVETTPAEQTFGELATRADGQSRPGTRGSGGPGHIEAVPATQHRDRADVGSPPATSSRPRMRLVPALPSGRPPVATDPVVPAVPTLRQRVRALRAADRELVLDGADEPGAPPDADPQQVACGIALGAVEVLAGRRSVAQLARWVTPGVYEVLRMRAALTAQAIGSGSAAGRHPSVRRVRVCVVAPGVVEAAVVAEDADRVRAVAVRLEGWRGQWRATALEIG
ncbi:Rv3235 family protein [Cellulomonas alba]|uniref:Rv3235 family protein n=1 Tax=Cellulomonas alba TaxID=3053467 RepID=A0ABT7SEH6_9CELL|nr:Rv3235 family protein [Cellulomonas alba]MDM7853982.1 Rv3235 family protein [Cellulomonas alba]